MTQNQDSTAKRVADLLLDLGAVEIRTDPPFTWASGRLSPVYCDNRLIISNVEARGLIRDFFIQGIADAGWTPQCIAGTATAGIPHAAWVAQRLELPMIYVRGSAKDHGRTNRIEGKLEKGMRVVVIEDLISTGSSSVGSALAVKEEGGIVQGVASIFTYGLKTAADTFKAQSFKWFSLCDFPALAKVARDRELLGDSDLETLDSWTKDPHKWSLERGGK